MNFVPPLVFNQRSEPWGKRMYSNHGDPHQTMASSGSVPTLCASVVAALKDDSVNPWTIAELALDWGCRTYSSGTTWSIHSRVALRYGFKKFVQSKRLEDARECINSGGYVICSVKQGYWSRVGNSILLYGIDNKYAYAIGTERRHGKRQAIDQFKHDLNMCFCYYPDTIMDH